MYEKVEKCPVCKGKSIDNHIICKDFTVSGESFAITKCASCGFLFTNPRPEQSIIQNYYQSEDYISHSDKGNNLTNILYKIVRNFTLRSKLRLLNKLTPDNKSLLDYGCGTGDFLNFCQSNNWTVDGVEPSDDAKTIAEQKIGQPIHSDIKTIDTAQSYHVITLWHVLEHVHDLNKLIKKLKKLLAKDGHFIIALPNCASYDQKIYSEHWAAYDVPRHLYHFNQQTFKTFADKHELKLVDTLPMKFDSFYVSLLSEQHIHNKSNYLKAFKNGLKSNQWAAKNNNNYSSLIYILKNK